jgi:hypothetical protein
MATPRTTLLTSPPGIFILEIDTGGEVLRYGTQSVQITDAAGAVHWYREGLQALSVTVGGQLDSIGVTVDDAAARWARIVARGGALERRPAVLRRYHAGQVLEDATEVIAGLTVDAEYAAPGALQRLTVSIEARAVEQGAVPPAAAVVGSETFSNSDPRIAGAVWPLVVGRPGYTAASVAARPSSPALFVETAANPRVLISYGPTEAYSAAKNVRIYDYTDEDDIKSNTAAVALYYDGTGQAYSAVLDASLASFSVTTGGEYWCGWEAGGGVTANDGSVMRGLGSVLLYLLQTFAPEVQIDRGAMASEAVYLDTFKIDTVINDTTAPLDYIRRALVPVFPIREVRGPNGLYFRAENWLADKSDAIGLLSANTRQVARASSVRSGGGSIANEITLKYRYERLSTYSRLRVLGARHGAWSYPGAPTDPRVLSSLTCATSQAVYGLHTKTIETAAIWEDATAVAVLEHLAAKLAHPKRRVRVTGGAMLESFPPGSVIAYTDSEIHCNQALALVDSVTLSAGDVALNLILLDDPIRTNRVTT